ncbi:glycosyltransferase family 2 protein [Pedobacter sp. SD-b]|uniref:Glycosyltransferase family 2 protein n=1 Tax=Pedobacter segetis TaxID=2793069 RepID=A0ABS1BG06_9SPHI|nr:glycosyltransferase family 2 protein [Pedobacter segetis]MBK0381799.1 glycosyltransferase family 2 protein [Pedobacter segetis]
MYISDINSVSKKPLVSVIITTLNRANVLKNAIDSALNQTYPHKEIIVIDDGSEDGTKLLLKSYLDKIKPIFKPNTGKSHSRNIGLGIAKGTIVATLDSDDVWYKDYLEKIVNYLLFKNLDIVFVRCAIHGFKFQKYTQSKYHVFEYEKIRKLILYNCPAPTSGVVMKRTILGIGWNNESMEYEDWHLQIACIVKNKDCRVAYVNEILWEKREDDEVKNKLKTTIQNQRRTKDTVILLNHLKAVLTKKEYKVIEQNLLKDTLKLLYVLIKNGDDKKQFLQNFNTILSKPILLINMIFSVLKNRIT